MKTKKNAQRKDHDIERRDRKKKHGKLILYDRRPTLNGASRINPGSGSFWNMMLCSQKFAEAS
jgi:hypothetical protein